jgi:hypothetical protein
MYAEVSESCQVLESAFYDSDTFCEKIIQRYSKYGCPQQDLQF